jgi:hypothetical protein
MVDEFQHKLIDKPGSGDDGPAVFSAICHGLDDHFSTLTGQAARMGIPENGIRTVALIRPIHRHPSGSI